MADLKTALAECVRLVKSNEPFYGSALTALHNLFHDHGDELLAVVRDAERYRWLRDRCDTTTGFLLGQRLEADEWDAAIDAAIAGRAGE